MISNTNATNTCESFQWVTVFSTSQAIIWVLIIKETQGFYTDLCSQPVPSLTLLREENHLCLKHPWCPRTHVPQGALAADGFLKTPTPGVHSKQTNHFPFKLYFTFVSFFSLIILTQIHWGRDDAWVQIPIWRKRRKAAAVFTTALHWELELHHLGAVHAELLPGGFPVPICSGPLTSWVCKGKVIQQRLPYTTVFPSFEELLLPSWGKLGVMFQDAAIHRPGN